MNSNLMKDCLVTPAYAPETNALRNNISFKSRDIHLKELPLGQRTYETPILGSNIEI